MAGNKEHAYSIRVEWTGNLGAGTTSYRGYSRSHRISAEGKQPIEGSSDPVFRGDAGRYNPEEMLVAALSACHMLWYLHLCAEAGIVVQEYMDSATGVMVETTDGGGRFSEVVLHPRVSVAHGPELGTVESLHERAHQLCFIANSINFPVRCKPITQFV